MTGPSGDDSSGSASRRYNEIHEKLVGVFVSAHTRHELERLREQAKEMLSAYADYVIEQATPEIREHAKQEHLISRVEQRSGALVAPGW